MPQAKRTNKSTASSRTQNSKANAIPKPRINETQSHGNIEETPVIPKTLQQQCLDIFRAALQPSSEDGTILQEIKGHLYNRDFAAAFGRPDYLRVYASRWSPSRALCYTRIFADVQEALLQGSNFGVTGDDDNEAANTGFEMKVICLGGGAGAELVALAAWQSRLITDNPRVKIAAHFVDIAVWDLIVAQLHQAVTTAPELSQYASAAARDANHAMLDPQTFETHFSQTDVLDLSPNDVHMRFSTAHLVTLMFTLNELYSTSVKKTQDLLAHMTAAMSPGSYLLVVDSPGSYSTVSINGADRKYPMQWLLDHTLLSPPPAASQSRSQKECWEKVVEDDSRWFRLPPGLVYPIDLENMRYQIHLYRRVADSDSVS